MYRLNYRLIYLLLITLVLGISSCCSSAKSSIKKEPVKIVDPGLYKEILHMDSVLFNAFNSHSPENLALLKRLFTEDLEFYHDKGGLTFYNKNMEVFTQTQTTVNDLKRELIPGTTEIYPINKYGAIQIGQHRFCHTEDGKQVCGSFKFVHVWLYKDGQWKISRVISYDH